MIRVVNYGSGRYERLAQTQDTGGYPRHTFTNPSPAPTKGDNYWRWKPEIITSVMRQNMGDFILYCDAGDLHLPAFWNWLPAYAAVADQLFVTRGYIHREWTKADCFEGMGMLPWINRVDHQLEAGLIGLRANEENLDLMAEWAQWMQIDAIVDNEPSKLPNHPDFREHRWDQSVLTNMILLKKYPIQHVNNVIWNAR